MSNRGDFVGTAPDSGNYIPAPVPQEEKDLPVYVNDELLRLGGVVNGMLEGGTLPPHSALPKRVREGMIMNFSQAVGNGVYSSGVWLYKQSKWWKLIDDPTNVEGAQFIYKETPTDTPPATPSPSGKPPVGWLIAPPDKTNKGYFTWVCVNTDYDPESGIYTWSAPTIFSAGVVDGEDGATGADGSTGAGFYQSEYSTIDWTEPTASNRFAALVGRAPVEHDIFIQTLNDYSDSEGREYDGNEWSPAGLYISGSIIASGTIAGDRIQAGTRIQAGNGNQSASLDGGNPTWRIYAGSDNAPDAPFRVDKDGNLFAEKGHFTGNIAGSGINGIRFKIGTFKTTEDGDLLVNVDSNEGQIYDPATGTTTNVGKTDPFTTFIGVSVSHMGDTKGSYDKNFNNITGPNEFRFNRDNGYDGTEYFSYLAFGI